MGVTVHSRRGVSNHQRLAPFAIRRHYATVPFRVGHGNQAGPSSPVAVPSSSPAPHCMPPAPHSARLETWSLRRQFVIPLGLFILAAAALVSLSTAWLDRQLERRYVNERFDRVHQQLAAANYPLRRSVLQQVRDYTGLEVILFSTNGRLSAASLDESVAGELLSRTQISRQIIDANSSGYRPVPWDGLRMDGVQIDGIRSPAFVRAYPLSPRHQSGDIRGAVLLLPQTKLSEQRSALVWAPAITGMASVLVMMLVTSWIATRLAARIKQLESHVGRLSTQDYQLAELTGPKDALYRLSERINTLAQQLAIAHAVIARTERTRLISLVSSGLAHEIRNSITGASLLIESVLSGLDAEHQPELEMAVNELQRASTSVKRILASDPNTVLSEESDLTLRQINESLRRTVGHYAQHHQVRVDISESHFDQIVPQGAAVLHCLLNLVMNAMEACGPGGMVEVRLARRQVGLDEDAQMVWQVWDDGPGPPASIASEIAEPFVTSKREGVGLGLAMAQRVATQFGGGLRWFRSRQRTCFEFSIRAPQSHPVTSAEPIGVHGLVKQHNA